MAPDFGLVAQPLYSVIEHLEHEIERDVFVRNRTRSQQVKLGIFDLDYWTTGVRQIMQLLIEGIAEGHDARRKIFVVLVLHGVSDQLGGDGAELDWPWRQALRRLPYF